MRRPDCLVENENDRAVSAIPVFGGDERLGLRTSRWWHIAPDLPDASNEFGISEVIGACGHSTLHGVVFRNLSWASDPGRPQEAGPPRLTAISSRRDRVALVEHVFSAWTFCSCYVLIDLLEVTHGHREAA